MVAARPPGRPGVHTFGPRFAYTITMRGQPVREVPVRISLPIWQELLVGVEMLFLRVSPVYWGYGIPEGDGSAVIVVPAFLGSDFYLGEFRSWLGRIGYRPYSSGIGVNAECPNLLIRMHLTDTIERAYRQTGRKVHLIGHSLGGLLARAAAAQVPSRVASLTTLGAPLGGLSIHSVIARAAESVRREILERNGESVLPTCYTPACTCNFVRSLDAQVPKAVRQTAIYTKADGIVDWRVCITGDPAIDLEVSATHMGLAFSPIAYQAVANRLFTAQIPVRKKVRRGTHHRSAV